MKTKLFFVAVSMLFLSSCSKQQEPASNEVFMQNSMFTPSTLTVSIGTNVTWTNKESAAHTVTSNTGAFGSGTMGQSATFSHTFNTLGTFPFHCTIHSGMTGTIIVQ